MGPDVLLRAYMTGNASKSPNAEQRMVEKYGLDRPAVVMYFKWFGNTLRGDMGYSLTASSRVSEAILARLPAMYPDGFTDSVFGFLSIVGWATPDYVMALLILVGSFTIFGWLPIGSLTTSLIKDWNTYSNSLIIDSILTSRYSAGSVSQFNPTCFDSVHCTFCICLSDKPGNCTGSEEERLHKGC